MNKRTITVIIGLLILLAGGIALLTSFSGKGTTDDAVSTHAQEDHSAEYYTCPMHPSVRSDRPGACPVCGMALVKKTSGAEMSAEEQSDLAHVSLSPSQRVIANVATARAKVMKLNKEINAAGTIAYAEPNFVHISTRFPGRIEKLYLNYTGQKVRKGDPVADLYSPEAISAQQELLLALTAYDRTKDAYQTTQDGSAQLLEQSRQKLLRWGFTEEQVRELEQTKTLKDTLTIYSPISGTILRKIADVQRYVATGEDLFDVADLSTVWLYLDVYEMDLAAVRSGQTVKVRTTSNANEEFTGKVSFIDQVIDPETRTVRVRAEFPNPSEKLKPGMYVQAQILVPSATALAVPASAVMFTGKRTVIWVERSPRTYEPRDVELGIRSGSFVEITSGLHEGETVVSSGGFLIESESELQQPSGGATGGHQQHGASPATGPTEGASSPSDAHGAGEHSRNNEVTVNVDGVYSPDIIHAKRGEKLTLVFDRKDEGRCTDEVVLKDFNIRQKLAPHAVTKITITPQQPGDYKFTCGMNMLTGTILVH